MITTTYKCDLCSKESGRKNFLHNLIIQALNGDAQLEVNTAREVCLHCLNSFVEKNNAAQKIRLTVEKPDPTELFEIVGG